MTARHVNVSPVQSTKPALDYKTPLVLHICETARGGVGTYIDTIIRTTNGIFRNLVILPDAHSEMICATDDKLEFNYKQRSAIAVARMLKVVLNTIKNRRPDLIFCHSSFSLAAVLLVRALNPRAKIIYCAHGWAAGQEMKPGFKRAFITRVEAFLTWLPSLVVSVSQTDYKHAIRHRYMGRHCLVENAVSPVSTPIVRSDPGTSRIKLLFVGRHDRQKGLDILLDAFAIARKKNPHLELTIIGEAVRTQSPTMIGGNTNDGVRFIGWVAASDIDQHYQAADLLVMPSRWEGLPLVLLEAMRNGTPTLVSNRSGLPELIEPGVSGLVADLTVPDVATALANLNRDKLSHMRDACLELFERRYHANRLGAEITNLYRRLLTA